MNGGVIDRRTRAAGIALAFVTAIVSGIAVFVNGYGVKRFPSPTVYTTAKNLVAACFLLMLALALRRFDTRPALPRDRSMMLGLVAVGIIGGGIPFVLFFEGLARASSTDAAFIQKTLVVWVVLVAVPLLHERVSPWHLGAIGLLVIGQATLTENLSGLRVGRGEIMIAMATLCWAAEVVIAKRVLRSVPAATLGAARMVIGVVVLVGWCTITGKLHGLVALSGAGWVWALGTGALLTCYVATWFAALARAQAVDVTAVLVIGALVTAFLDAVVEGTALRPDAVGLVLVGAGAAVLTIAARRELPAGAPA